jgi:hypothetical protein
MNWKYVCKECGSENILFRGWYKAMTHEFVRDCMCDDFLRENTMCDDCKANSSQMLLFKYGNEWITYEEMERRKQQSAGLESETEIMFNKVA